MYKSLISFFYVIGILAHAQNLGRLQLERRVIRPENEKISTHQTNSAFLNYSSLEDFETCLKESRLSENEKSLLRALIKSPHGKTSYLMFDTSHFPEFSPAMRNFMESGSSMKEGTALNVGLVLDAESDIKEIAKKYAMGRDAEEVEKQIRSLVAEKSPKGQLNRGDEIEISLQSILTPAIRDHANTFTASNNTNCIGTALCALEGEDYLLGYNDRKQLKEKFTAMGFEAVESSQAPKVGDLLIFNLDEKNPDHAAIYIGDGIVLTKNGHKASAIMFQHIDHMEKANFEPRSQRINLYLFRRNSNNAGDENRYNFNSPYHVHPGDCASRIKAILN